MLKSKAKHAAISSRLRKPFDFKSEKPLVVQYEVTMQVSSLSLSLSIPNPPLFVLSIAKAVRIASAA